MDRFGPLLAQRMRRDWRQLLMWAIGIFLLAYLAYVGVVQSYGTEADRTALLATVAANPVILLFRGLPSGPGEAQVMVFLIFPWLALLAAMMSTFLAVRHTRTEEEDGRADLVSATPAGRMLPLVATAAHGILVNVVVAALVALAYLVNGQAVGGSVLLGAATGGVGIAFLGIGLVAAQLWRTSRGANAASVWITVGALVVAGIGNALGTPSDDLTRIESSWLTWVSPIGWGENTRAFADDAWWPAILCLAFGLALAAVSLVLVGVRDVGAGFIAERRGRADAPRTLVGPQALVWRLNRGALVGWAVGGVLTGLLSTSLASVVEQMGSENPAVEEVLRKIAGGTGAMDQATITVFFTLLGVLAACCAVQIAMRARQEEAHGTAEPVLTAPVGRVRWLGDYLAVGFGGIVVTIAAGVLGAALGLARGGGDASLMRDVWVAAGGQLVAAAVFLALTALIFVLVPRATIPAAWTLVLVATIFGMFGPLFGFPDALVRLAPFGNAPHMDGSDLELGSLWWLLAVTAVGVAGSLFLIRRRELATGD